MILCNKAIALATLTLYGNIILYKHYVYVLNEMLCTLGLAELVHIYLPLSPALTLSTCLCLNEFLIAGCRAMNGK